MRNLAFIGAVLALGACKTGTSDTDNGDTDSGAYSLTFTGNGYDPHDGATLYANLMDGSTIVDTQEVVVADGTFTLTFADELQEGTAYTLGWYVDVDGDDACTDPPADHVWTHDIAAVTADVDYAHTHSTDFALCADAGF